MPSIRSSCGAAIGYVIQQIGLFPNMTVAENIGVVPRLLGWERDAPPPPRRGAARDAGARSGASSSTAIRTSCPGGQAQRIGVARALAADPPVLLMDEPFGALDPVNREVIQDEFLRMQRKLRKTILFVSHDIDEAVKMADRIAIFRGGRLVQYAAPDELLAHPADAFVAGFVGSDRTLKRLRLIRVREVMAPVDPRAQRSDAGGPPSRRTTTCAASPRCSSSTVSKRCAASATTGRVVGRVTRAAVAARLAEGAR